MQNSSAIAGDPPLAPEPHRRGVLRPRGLTPVRRRMSSRWLAAGYAIVDAAVGVGLAALAFHSPGLTAIAGLQLLCMHTVGAYTLVLRGGARRLRHIAIALVAGGAAGLLIGLSARPLNVAVLTLCLGGTSLVWAMATALFHRQGRLTPNLMVVGATHGASRLIERLTATREAAVLGVFDDRAGRTPKTVGGVPVLGDVAALIAHRLTPFVDRIVVAVPKTADARVNAMVERLGVLPNDIVLLLDDEGAPQGRQSVDRIAALPLTRLSGQRASAAAVAAKRMQDLVIGTLALVLALPIMLLVAIAVKLDSPGPVFFRQKRHGFHNETIRVWKFRSMHHAAADATAARQVAVGDDRVTRVGRFIRSTSLDELPQLFNVLRGEMSLVGPRPHAIGMRTGAVESAALVAHYAHRHRIKPGMTGWAAIHGSRGPVDTPELVRERVRLDVEYIERQSLRLDLYIMLMTIPCLIGDPKRPR